MLAAGLTLLVTKMVYGGLINITSGVQLFNFMVPADEVLFAEMVVIADALAFRITDLYKLGSIEIKGIGEF